QSFVDRSELAHGERTKIDGAERAVWRLVDEEMPEGVTDDRVVETDRIDQGTLRMERRIGSEQPPVVGGNVPGSVAGVDDSPHLAEVVPDGVGAGIELVDQIGLFREVAGPALERVAGVAVVALVRQQALVLGIRLEQEP